MATNTYQETKDDYNYLDSVCPGGDMMEIDGAVFELMANPTKKLAKRMYETAIQQWFSAIGGKGYQSGGHIDAEVLSHPQVVAIGKKYGHIANIESE